MSDLPFYALGFALLVHVIFVSITIGVGWISAFARLNSYLKNDAVMEGLARRIFRILVVFELFSGVWGTIITVFLAGFFPSLLALATNVLFVPLLIALISIMIRIPSIGIFWYTWGRIHPRTHSMIGVVMAISGFAIPFGFRAVFSEINSPTAVAEFLAASGFNPFAAYSNPVFWILYLHTIFAALSVGGFTVAYLASTDGDRKGMSLGYSYGMLFLLAQLAVGFIYWANLKESSNYLFSSITFGSFLPVFALKLFTVSLLLFFSILGYTKMSNTYAKYSLILALAAVFFGELLNGGARYPYLVVAGSEGFLIKSFLNFYIEVPMAAVFLIFAFLLVSLAVFSAAIFYALFRRFLSES